MTLRRFHCFRDWLEMTRLQSGQTPVECAAMQPELACRGGHISAMLMDRFAQQVIGYVR